MYSPYLNTYESVLPLSRADCEAQTSGFPKARFKKFATFKEAEYFALGMEASNAAASTTNEERSLPEFNTRKRSRSPNVEDEGDWDVVYSDGACKGNGQVGSVAGIGVWWGPDDPRLGNFIPFCCS